MAGILRDRGVGIALLLDDDVVVQQDLSFLWDDSPEAALAGKAMAASCKHWRIKNSAPVLDTAIGYLEVPYFGFGAINRWRTLEEATCRAG